MNRILLSTAMALALSVPAAAQDIQETKLQVVGSWSSLPLHKKYEQPFFNETLPGASEGKITAELTTFDQMGVKGADVYRLLSNGVFDIGLTVADYTVGDAPELEGLDVPLVATDAATAREMVEAAKPMVEEIMRDRFNGKLLAIAPYPPQIVFCNAEIGGLADLKGKKVRGSGRMTTKLLEALGAEGVNVSFSEVPGALERGVVDCAVTGSGSGYAAGWWESSTHLLPLPLGGWDAVPMVMNLDRWNGLNEATQNVILEQAKSGFEDPAWEEAGSSLENDLACLTGNGECSSGDPASMTLVEATEGDTKVAETALKEEVLPDWAERAGADWAKRWNESVGQVVGVEVPAE